MALYKNKCKDLVAEFWGGGKRVWNRALQAWEVTHDDDAFSANITAGHNEVIYVPGNTTISIYSTIRLVDNIKVLK